MKTYELITKFLMTFIQHIFVSDVLKSEANNMNVLGGDRFCLNPKMSKKSDFYECIADFL